MAAPRVLATHVMVKGLPALTEGGVLSTVTITDADEVHPLRFVVLTTVYSVVTDGFAVGLLTLVALNPAAGLHE
jgi:hypothetical protein